MTVTASILRLAGMTLLVVAVTACSGLDRATRDAATDTGADGDVVGSGSIGSLEAELGADIADADDALSADPDGLLDGAGPGDLDVDLGPADPADTSAPATSTGSGTSPTPAPLPTFDAGSFADLDADLSTLDFALGAGEAGSEGNLP